MLVFFSDRKAGNQSASAIAGGINFSDGALNDTSYTIRMNSGTVPSTTGTSASSGTNFQQDSQTHYTKKEYTKKKLIDASKYLNFL